MHYAALSSVFLSLWQSTNISIRPLSDSCSGRSFYLPHLSHSGGFPTIAARARAVVDTV
jgi:hypothetical protein